MVKSRKGGGSVKLAIVLIVVIVAIGVVAALKPWDWLNQGTVRFYSLARFYLSKTEDNKSLDNVLFGFPDLTLGDNKILSRDYIKSGYWVLYAYVDNQLVEEVRDLTTLQLVPPRTSEPVVQDMGASNSFFGPKYSLGEVDHLYPGEVLELQLWWEVPASMAERLTLRDSEGQGTTYAHVYSTPAKNISGQFFAGFYRLNNDNIIVQKVEEFSSGVGENLPSIGWWGLDPV
jgi:hypothetical protein